MRGLKFQATIAILILLAAVCSGQSSNQAALEGIVRIGPTQAGPIKADTPASKPFANATFVVQNEKGVVTTFTTDDQGRFHVSLDPGRYSIAKDKKPAIGHFGPFPVEILAGKTTKVEWECDSGVR